MRRHPRFLLLPVVCALALAPSCSLLGGNDSAAEVEASPIALEAENTTDLFAVDPFVDVSADDVLAAIARLELDRAVTTTRTSDGSWLMMDEELTRSVESVVYDPTSDVQLVTFSSSTDIETLAADMKEAFRLEAESDADETMLPAFAVLGAATAVPVEYYVVGETAYIPYSALEAYQRAEALVFITIDSEGFEELYAELQPDGSANPTTEELVELYLSFATVQRKDSAGQVWLAAGTEANTPFPAGFGSYVGPGFALSRLDQVGFDGASAPDDLMITETERTGETISFTLSSDRSSIDITLNAELDVVSMVQVVEGATDRFDFDWTVDSSLLVLPSDDLIIEEDELSDFFDIEPYVEEEREPQFTEIRPAGDNGEDDD